MSLDATKLRDFYRTSLGQIVRRELSSRVRSRWGKLDGLTVVGAGFATPFLGSFRTEVARLGCLMPSRQGAVVWPHSAPCQSILVDEYYWPLPDNSVDRLLAVHCLEQAERIGPLLREMWRVLSPNGSLLLVVPNRRGLWSHVEATPFGHGLPYSRSQLESQLIEAMFTPVDWSAALYFPPLKSRLLLKLGPTIDRFGSRFLPPVAGVIVVEACKELVAPAKRGKVKREISILKPIETPGPAASR
jgi:SAM-dependent methyltransferase